MERPELSGELTEMSDIGLSDVEGHAGKTVGGPRTHRTRPAFRFTLSGGDNASDRRHCVEFRVLGPLEVSTAGGAVTVTGPKRRALLARFLVDAGETLSAERLIDDLWDGAPPRSATTTLQTFVYQLRRRYGIEGLRTTPAGYVLEVDGSDVDTQRFERAAGQARAGARSDPAAAMHALRAALDMWRGRAYAEFANEAWAVAEAARLEELRLDALEAWAVSAIGTGLTAGLIAELDAATSRNPLREPLWALHVIALARDGRPAEALRVVTRLREVLRDELGVDPSASFNAIETAILREEPLPDWPDLGGFGLAPGSAAATAPADAPPAGSAPLPSSMSAHPAATGRVQGRRRRPAALLRSVPTMRANDVDLFVGRAAELQLLESALETASNGVPQIVLITGEAGIGKSRLLDEFTPHAVSRGVQVLAGACQEDDAVPYLPLASAFAALDSMPNPFEQVAFGNAGANDDRSRLALFLAATRWLLTAARQRVTLLLLEDLHWVDDATLSLLRHTLVVVGEDGELDRTRLLIVLTSRPPDPDAPAATLIARLRREPRTVGVDLDALTEPECRELTAEWLGARPSRSTSSRLFEATAGNPLVLRSTLGRLHDLGSAITDSAVADLVGPTDLDHELWRRVEHVGDACGEMLLSAAFLGGGARLELLATACALDADELDVLIDEAAGQQLLVADDERYWFAHPQLRQLVYHWPAASERAARHLQLADRLEPEDTDVRMIAHHLVRAGALAEPARLLRVCGEAADRSAAVGAWRDAAKYAAVAVDAAEQMAHSERELTTLEFRAAHAAHLARDVGAVQKLEAVAERARSCGAADVWGRALVHLARERVGTLQLQPAVARSLASLDEFLDLGSDDPALRGEVHALEAELYFDLGDFGAANRHNAAAEACAEEAEDAELRVRIAFARGLQHLGSVELPEAKAWFERAFPLAQTLADPNPHIWCTSRLGVTAYAAADLDRADELLADAGEAARHVDNPRELSMADAFQTAVAAVKGRFATAELHAERALRAYREAETPFTPAVVFPALAAARAHRGDAAGAHEALDMWDALGAARGRRYRPLVDAFVGRVDAAHDALERPAFRVFAGMQPTDAFLTGALAAQVELAALAGRPDLVPDLLEVLVEAYERGMRFAIGWPSFIPRVIALGLASSGRVDAEIWFERALNDADDAHATAEVARTALDYARVIDGPRTEELLTRAADARASISDPDPVPAAGRRRSARRASPRAEHEARPATRVLLVTDLVGSTALNDRLGDREYVERLRAHDEIIRRRLDEFDGVEFKHTGDGIGAWFFSVNGALCCARALAHDFGSARAGPLRVKIALSAGEPTMIERDLIGLAVTLAFRVLELARPDEVLVTSDVAGIARGLDWAFEPHGAHRLKGLQVPVEVLRVIPTV
ncbi:MAG: transcriptional regulator [Actinomycetia bacterium]|nr:transcriptional regulator [Actinomycetes bacterium]